MPSFFVAAGPGQNLGIEPRRAINSGVGLMRLDLIRDSSWTTERDALIAAWREHLSLGVQFPNHF